MPVGKEKQVLAFAFHFERFGFVFHHIAIEGNEKLGAAQRAARVSALAIVHHPHNIAPHLGGECFQF